MTRFNTNTPSSTLIFEYPTSANSPNLKTILSAIKGIGAQSYNSNSHNSSIVEISKIHTIYKLINEKITIYALVENLSAQESLSLKSLNPDASDDDDDENDGENKENNVSIINPNFIFRFLDRILEILQDYFGHPLNSLKIEANYDIMCNLMQEILEGGYPYITDNNTLKDLVPFKSSLGSKILQTTNQLAKSYSSSSSHNSFANQPRNSSSEQKLPWRSSNVKYTNNELFVDIKETINVILTPHQQKNKKTSGKSSNIYNSSTSFHHQKLIPTVARIHGEIDFTSHLSGVPEILCYLNLNGHYLGVPSLHRCVRTDKWINNEGTLSFIPPDGKSTIMNYTIDLDSYPTNKIQRNIGFINPDFKTGLGLKKNEFEISLNINFFKNVSKLENLKIQLFTNHDYTIKILRLSHGDFQTKSNGKFEWIFDPIISLGINPILRGIVEKTDDDETYQDTDEKTPIDPVFPKSISISYSNKGALPSGIRVDSLKITRGLNDIKPYKGVKYITQTGEFIIR
ncbi:hypothetical protein WICANDRAFT_83623 [Wickerhamomyces anomalus NRRL Y-366-8]|uniref:MHD domain-containing protein n=1 Tax=Wickerhamomyces anomalus (strain ATCC 58044 / CBS 1984 / NCYC 433 / NRRL Y-366-8) TaxID=683960 RepID=A0A1E3P7Y0_WICAA|nr:uncharacterized protein WICANDRAFT_83623 [Wickerhamomyces anomalus NRRL Y-366-8]ODQ61513.1 hypothetical protein WICANDRAFT_83623 [Wickerhamomyces anomalus NRRL Y-366-8]